MVNTNEIASKYKGNIHVPIEVLSKQRSQENSLETKRHSEYSEQNEYLSKIQLQRKAQVTNKQTSCGSSNQNI